MPPRRSRHGDKDGERRNSDYVSPALAGKQPGDCSLPKTESRRIALSLSTQPQGPFPPGTTSMVPRAAGAPEARPIPATNRSQDSTARDQALEEQVLPFRRCSRSERVMATAHLQRRPLPNQPLERTRELPSISCLRIKSPAILQDLSLDRKARIGIPERCPDLEAHRRHGFVKLLWRRFIALHAQPGRS
jgi:hypothetical protein